MVEKKFDFIEEVIKEKPKKWKAVLKKILSILGIVTAVGLLGMFLAFLFWDDWKEIFSETVQHSGNGKDNIKIELDKEEISSEELEIMEKNMGVLLVSIYQTKIEGEKDKFAATGIILYEQEVVYILTSYEQISNIKETRVKFADGEFADAVLVNQDEKLGIAILKVEGKEIKKETAEKIHSAVIGEIDDIGRGTKIVYQGSPYSDHRFVLLGEVSGISEEKQMSDLYFRKLYLNTSYTQIKEGFIFDYAGNFLGMVLESVSSGEQNLITAVAICDIIDLVENLLNKQQMGYLGIYGESVGSMDKNYISNDISEGIYISGVDKNSAAYGAGVMKGDILQELNGEKVEDMSDLQKRVLQTPPGEHIYLLLKRKIADTYHEVKLQIKLGKR